MKRLQLVLAVTACLLLFAAAAYASGGEGHEIPWGNFGFRVLNFVLVVGLIYKFAGAKISDFFKGRRAGIQKDLDDLKSRKEAAEKRLKEVEQSISNLQKEKEAILADARAQGEALKQAIVEKAHKAAGLIKAQAKASAENEAKAAFEKIKAELADKVVEAAAKIVQEKLSAQDHEKLVDEYLTKVVLN